MIVTSLPYFACVAAVVKMDSVISIGDAASIFSVYYLCFCPLAHAQAFMEPSLFRVKYMREFIAFCFSSYVNLFALTGSNVSMSCSCWSFFVTAFSPCYPYSFSPLFKLYCIIIYSHVLASTSSDIFKLLSGSLELYSPNLTSFSSSEAWA